MDQPGGQVGSYRLLKQIGQGGMGEVWLAEHALLKRRAAVKLLRPHVSASEEMVTRFFNEARAATAISDPGIVQIYDFGNQDGVAYIVMELLDGETLDKRLGRLGVLSVEEALRFMRQIASSLGAAHARQIVHRDLKPENIFLIRDPEVPGGERAKILDFGIAKLTHDEVALKTQTAAVMGTPMYMSPEQCRGAGGVDQRSDIYSLGCMLFTLLTGRTPFDARGFGELIAKHMYEEPPAPSSLSPRIPPEVEALILRCMAKDPADRFDNGHALAAALEAAGARVRASANAIPYAPAHSVTPRSLTAPTVGTVGPNSMLRSRSRTTLSAAAGSTTVPPPPSVSSKAGPVMLALGGLAVVGGIIAFVATRHGSADEAKPAAAAATQTAATPDAGATRQITAALVGFVRWSATHAHDGCPNAATLAPLVDGGLTDPWGHELSVTCTDQPSDQIVGVTSAGPDGAFGTRDDIASWRLDATTTEVVRGARWAPAANPTTAKATAATPAAEKLTAANPTAANPNAANPSAANPSAANPSAANPSAANPSAANPNAMNPTTAKATAANPTTNPTTAKITAANPNAANPNAANPNAANPNAANRNAKTTTNPTTANRTAKTTAKITTAPPAAKPAVAAPAAKIVAAPAPAVKPAPLAPPPAAPAPKPAPAKSMAGTTLGPDGIPTSR